VNQITQHDILLDRITGIMPVLARVIQANAGFGDARYAL
jgi:hypothetical protein